jgi:hypothetical protein
MMALYSTILVVHLSNSSAKRRLAAYLYLSHVGDVIIAGTRLTPHTVVVDGPNSLRAKLPWLQRPCPIYYEVCQDLGFDCCSWLKGDVVIEEFGCPFGYSGICL